MTCPRTDEVIAAHLDGEVPTAAGEALAAHAANCSACRAALAQSRHLDAAVAAAADLRLPPAAQADAMVAAAVAAAWPVQVASPRRRRLWPIALAAAAAFLAGAVLAWSRWSRPVAPMVAVAPDRDTGPTPQELPPTPRDVVVLPGQAAPWSAPERGIDRLRRAELALHSTELGAAVRMLALARTAWSGLPPVLGAVLETAVRADAARVLLAAPSHARTLSVARALARAEPEASALCAALRGDRLLATRLRAELNERCEPELVLAAAALGDADLDRRIVTRCRRDEALADAVAGIVAGGDEPCARIDFLLDLWTALDRSSDDGGGARRDDLDRANLWFGGLGPPAAAALLARLRGSRSDELRRRCLLALASVADPASIEPLLAVVERPHLPEAELAAYALGALPRPAAERVRRAIAVSRRPELLRAALVSLGDRAARGVYLEHVGPLADGVRLRPEEIAAAARAFRRREPALLRP